MGKLTRAVILESYLLTERKLRVRAELFNEYEEKLQRWRSRR